MMRMPAPNDPQFLAFRYERMKNSPNNWLFWIASFSLFNGIFLTIKQDTMLPAAMISPYAFAGAIPHFIAAAVFVVLGVIGRKKIPVLTYAGIGVYLLDTIYIAVSGVSAASALVLHAVVLLFIGFTILRTKSLAKQLAASQRLPDPFPNQSK